MIKVNSYVINAFKKCINDAIIEKNVYYIIMNISRYLKKDDKYLELYKTKKGGLKNIGATCYINTLIQCLASSPYFIRFILSNDFQDRLENNKNNEDNKKIIENIKFLFFCCYD